MIKKDEVFKIGIFNKPHGVKGEISFTFTDDIFDRVECEYLVCLLDGIFVPFFIEEYRFSFRYHCFSQTGRGGYLGKGPYVYECRGLFPEEICR